MMYGWWSSTEFLNRVSTWTQVLIAVFGVLTAAATVVRIIVGNRVSYPVPLQIVATRTTILSH
jgi:uncharacterized membrane protein